MSFRLLLLWCCLGILLIPSLGYKGFAQPDSVFVPPTDTLPPKVYQKSQNKLSLKLPIFVEDDRLKLALKLPGRKDISFTFPKVVYAGKTPPFDPNVSYQRSLLIPGWGQYYNRSKWKIPIIYAGYGAVGYLILNSHNNYKDYQRAYRVKIQMGRGIAVSGGDSVFISTGDPRIVAADTSGLVTIRDQYRSARDRYILAGIGYHLFWVLEAYVSAHLKGLDVSEDLSMKFSPGIFRNRRRDRNKAWALGATVTLQF